MAHEQAAVAAAQARSLQPREVLVRELANYPVTTMFVNWFVFPGVTAVHGQVGAWDTPGQQRILDLADGGQVTETLVRYNPAAGWTNQLTNFTNIFGHLIAHVDDAWLFEQVDGVTRISWSWTFHARHAARLVRLVVAPLYGRYLQRILDAALRDIELRTPVSTSLVDA